MKKEPILILFAGLAAVVAAVLTCFVITGALRADLAAAIGIAVESACGLAGAVLRSQMDSPATIDEKIVTALQMKPPLLEADLTVATEHVHELVAAKKAA